MSGIVISLYLDGCDDQIEIDVEQAKKIWRDLNDIFGEKVEKYILKPNEPNEQIMNPTLCVQKITR